MLKYIFEGERAAVVSAVVPETSVNNVFEIAQRFRATARRSFQYAGNHHAC